MPKTGAFFYCKNVSKPVLGLGMFRDELRGSRFIAASKEVAIFIWINVVEGNEAFVGASTASPYRMSEFYEPAVEV